MVRLKSIVVVVLFVFAIAPAWGQGMTCPPPTQPMLRAQLYFGLATGSHGEVSAGQWARFLAGEVTSRFPDGLTVLDGRGQWRNPATRVLMRERSKLIIIVAADGAATRRRLIEIATVYKQRFKQKSVGLVLDPVCAAF